MRCSQKIPTSSPSKANRGSCSVVHSRLCAARKHFLLLAVVRCKLHLDHKTWRLSSTRSLTAGLVQDFLHSVPYSTPVGAIDMFRKPPFWSRVPVWFWSKSALKFMKGGAISLRVIRYFIDTLPPSGDSGTCRENTSRRVLLSNPCGTYSTAHVVHTVNTVRTVHAVHTVGGVCAQFVHGRSCMTTGHRIPTMPGERRSGFSPTRQTLLALSATFWIGQS